jgi:hypothetical protein
MPRRPQSSASVPNAAVVLNTIDDLAQATNLVPFGSLAAIGGQSEGDVELQGSARFDACVVPLFERSVANLRTFTYVAIQAVRS